MAIQKTKDPESVYDKVKEYDIVLTADAPLADAINRCLEKPVFGEFANTPRRLVRARYDDSLEKRDLFARAVSETDMTWKQASYLLDLVVECWQHTGDPSDVLDTRYTSSETELMVEIVKNERSIYSRMENHTIGEDMEVAVVGWHNFDELDKKPLPKDYDRISIFEDEEFSLPEFRVFESATSLVEAIRGNVTQENANRVAVVADRNSKKEKLIKSALQSDGVPYIDASSLSKSDGLRTLLKLLRTALSDERVKVSEIRPVLRRIGADDHVPPDIDEVYLSSLELDVPGLDDFLSGVEEMTFEDAVERYEELSDTDMDGVRETLEDAGLLHREVTDTSVNRLRYYFDTYDVTQDVDTGGVLFASPSASTVDRPLVFYVGMDESWTADVPDRPWVEEEVLNQRHLKNFQQLIQNGSRQYYMVQETEGSETVTPCFYFHELLDREQFKDDSLEGFTSFENHDVYTGVPETKRDPFERKELDIETGEVETISQSSLNELVKSPRSYFFDRVLEEPESRHTVRGNVLHDFAEFYTNYPEFVRDEGIEEFVDEAIEKMEPYVDSLEIPILRTEFLNGAEAVAEYLDGLSVPEETPEGYQKQGSTNIFAEMYDRPIETGGTELWFKNEELGGHGRVDLVVDETTLLDYKTGSKDRETSVIENTKVSTYDPEEVDFQPILYLAHHRDVTDISDGDRMEFRLLYMLESVGDRISGNHSVEDDIVTVPYVDMEFEEYVASKEAFETLSDVKTIDKSFSQMGYEPYKEFFEDRSLPDEVSDKEALRDVLLDEFTEYTKEYVGDYKYVRKSCRSALGNIASMRGKDILFEDEMDEFLEFVDEQVYLLNEYRRTEFPVGDIDVEDLREKELVLERHGEGRSDEGGQK